MSVMGVHKIGDEKKARTARLNRLLKKADFDAQPLKGHLTQNDFRHR